MTDTNGDMPPTRDDQNNVDEKRPVLRETPPDGAPEKAKVTPRERARSIREKAKYRSRLTLTLLNQLAPLLVQATPRDLGPGIELDRGFAHLLFQRSVMDDVLLPYHWRDLIHYEDGGRTARVWVVVGNRLGRVKLNPTTGALKPGPDAEIIKAWDGWGGLDSANSKGDLLKSSQTSALRRLLAQIGPGQDAFTTPASTPEHREQYVPDLTAIAGAGEPKADELDVKSLLKIIRDRGLAPSQVATLIRAAVGAPPVEYHNDSAAREFVDERLNDRRVVLARDVVPRLKRLLEEATPESPRPAGDAREGDGAAGASGAHERRTVPFEPTTTQAA